jgi:ankyrin repeat domain-containing protein 50
MFRSLLYQLYRTSSIAREKMYEAFEEKRRGFGHQWKWQVSELEKLLKDVVKEVARKKEVTIFVDALDEAVDENGEKAAPSLLQFFHELNESAVAEEGYVGGVKICVSCRPYPVLGPDADEIFVEEHNKYDMQRFVRDKLSTVVQGWDEEPQDARRSLVDVIVSTSRGVFLWTSLQLPRIIRSLNDGEVSFEEINDVVAAKSSELFDLYQGIFSNDVAVHLRKKSLHFLQWVCLAQRPLTLTELRFALACDDEDVPGLPKSCEESTTFIGSDTRMEKLASSLSGGLAEVRHYTTASTVQFIHETVNDFVRDRGFDFLASMTDTPVSNLIARGENRLSRSCINYFKMEQVSKETLRWHDFGEEKPPFIEYTCKFWFQHAERAERGGISQENLVKRFESSSQAFRAWTRASTIMNFSDSRCPTVGSILIHVASGSNLQSIVRKLMQNNTSVNQRDSNGDMPLHWATRHGHEQMASLLLDFGAEINVKNTRPPPGSTPLEIAAANGHSKLVRLLLKRGADVNGTDDTEGGPLQEAVSIGNLPLAKILIESGADVKGCNQGKRNPLHQAAMIGHEPIARFLIREGADVNIQGGILGNPLQAAILANCEPLVRLLLDSGADVNAQGGSFGNALQAACTFKEQIELVKLLLDMGADINAIGGEYGTALQAACISDSDGVVQMLLNDGADVNLQGGLLGSPIIAAAKAGSEIIVGVLLENGARVEAQGGEYGNVLQAATVAGNSNLVELFLAKGVDVNVTGGLYGSALQAAMVHSPALVDLLLGRGADVTIPGPEYGNALHAAVFFSREHYVQVLLEMGAGANINARLPESTTSKTFEYPYNIQRAAFNGNVRIVKALLEHGAEINTIEGMWGSALTIAAAKGYQDVFELLLDRGADTNLDGGFNGSTFKAARKHKEINRILMERCKRDENPGNFHRLRK